MQQTHHATDAWYTASLQVSSKKFSSWAAAQQLLTKLELLMHWEADINNMLELLKDTQHEFGCLPSQTTDEPMPQAPIQIDIELDHSNDHTRMAILVRIARRELETKAVLKTTSMEIRRKLEVAHTVLMHAFWQVGII